MAAMAAAQLEDGSSINIKDSICSNHSTSRRATDISIELSGSSEGKGEKGRIGSDRVREQTNTWSKNKGEKLTEGTPDTTTTTSSSGDDGSKDGSMGIVIIRDIAETPPVPKELRSRSRQEYDQCSPLPALKLDFGANS